MKQLFFPVFLILSIFTNAQDLNYYLPTVNGELVEHEYYVLDYSEEHEQASWVAYFSGVHGSVKRKDAFKGDESVSTISATLNDYADSGYDRGHLAPAADMNVSALSMKESFFMSNMSPQLPGFNRGVWKRLEALVRAWGQGANSEFDVIVTGPLLSSTCGVIGDGVTIPCAYFKIYADPSSGKAVGFILQNESSSAQLSTFAVSINEIELRTGIDFFPSLEDIEEEELESQLDITVWDWKAKPTTTSASSHSSDLVAEQCKGITGSGKRCSRSAGASGFCWQHN